MDTGELLSSQKVPSDPLPYIAVVVPNMREEVDELVRRLNRQSWPPDEIQVIRGISPNGRARNMGVSAARPLNKKPSDFILIFIDDDALPGNGTLIEALVKPLLSEQGRKIGVTGAARVLPPSANWFQRRVAAEIPRTINPIPSELVETNPPLDGYGHSLITTTCCATWYSIYESVGGFSDDLVSGVDTDFFYRIRQCGYRFTMVPDEYVEHPAPKNVRALIRKYYWYGVGYGQEAQRRPQQNIGPRLRTRFLQWMFLLLATLWMIPNIFFLYSYGYPHFEFGFRPLKAVSTYAVAHGYVAAWHREVG